MRSKRQTEIMGIINLTPDSFSGDGISCSKNPITATLKQAEQMLADGADILDLGAESSRPNSKEISAAEEQARLLPALSAIQKEFSCPISIDTWRAATAHQGLSEGATIINSIWGIKKDRGLLDVVKKQNATLIIMHNSSDIAQKENSQELGGYYSKSSHENIVQEVLQDLQLQIVESGLEEGKVIIDPGLGFGKTVAENITLLKKLEKFTQLKCPLLIGASRKSFIGHTLDLPVDQRLAGSLACAAVAVQKGASIVRTHDVKETSQVCQMVEALQ